jgi:hypothetical protein
MYLLNLKSAVYGVIEKQYPRLLQEVRDMNVKIDLSEYYINNIGKIVGILSSILTE